MLISIIIPTLNRARNLNLTLLSIAQNNFRPEDFELIVVDNGSTDQTKEICARYQKSIPNLTYLYDAEPGSLTGRHLGLQKAKGSILCYLDDDIELNPNYLESVKTLFQDDSINLATGPSLPKYETYPPTWLTYFWTNTSGLGSWCGWLSLLDFGSEIKNIDPNFVWSLNLVVRKNVLLELKGFHPDLVRNFPELQGDGETGLTLKAIEAGYLATYDPALLIHHHVDQSRLTPAYFLKRAYFQGICNSYTQLRKQHLTGAEGKLPRNKLRDKLHPYYRWIKRLKPKKSQSIPEEVKLMIENLSDSEKKGFDFHQQNFKNSTVVRDWVLREDYLAYKLPKYD